VASAPCDVAVARKPEKVLDDAAFAKERADSAVSRAKAKGIEILRPSR